jgi:GMP synthase-like glutamine amidotransferase
MHVLAFRHAPLEGIGSIADALARAHLDCRSVDLYCDPAQVAAIDDAAGLIFMGGPMSVNDPLSWISQEVGIIQQAAERGLPVLGICLGAQLIARALGSRVYPNPVKEIGWASVCVNESVSDDTLFRGFTGPQMVFQWHGETFDLPAGSDLLARGDVCPNQAFRFRSNMYALQFHLEVTPAIIEDCLRLDQACGPAREAAAPIDPQAHSLESMASVIFDRWCGLLR